MHPWFYTAKATADHGVEIQTTWLGDWGFLILAVVFGLGYFPIVRSARQSLILDRQGIETLSFGEWIRHQKFVFGFPVLVCTLIAANFYLSGYHRMLDDTGLHVLEGKTKRDFSWDQVAAVKGGLNSTHFVLRFSDGTSHFDIELDQRVTKPELQDVAIELAKKNIGGRMLW